MKKLALSTTVLTVVLSVVAVLISVQAKRVSREADALNMLASEKPVYTFKSCERHLALLVYLFGDDPALWPEHEHAPMPGDDSYHRLHNSIWGQHERDFLVYEHSANENLVWEPCGSIEGVYGHVHTTDPELTKKQHESPTPEEVPSISLIGPEEHLKSGDLYFPADENNPQASGAQQPSKKELAQMRRELENLLDRVLYQMLILDALEKLQEPRQPLTEPEQQLSPAEFFDRRPKKSIT